MVNELDFNLEIKKEKLKTNLVTIIYRFFHIRGWRALVKECSKKRNK